MPDRRGNLGHPFLFFVCCVQSQWSCLDNLRGPGQTIRARSSRSWPNVPRSVFCALGRVRLQSSGSQRYLTWRKGTRVFAEGVEFKSVYYQPINSEQTVTTPTLPCKILFRLISTSARSPSWTRVKISWFILEIMTLFSPYIVTILQYREYIQTSRIYPNIENISKYREYIQISRIYPTIRNILCAVALDADC